MAIKRFTATDQDTTEQIRVQYYDGGAGFVMKLEEGSLERQLIEIACFSLLTDPQVKSVETGRMLVERA